MVGDTIREVPKDGSAIGCWIPAELPPLLQACRQALLLRQDVVDGRRQARQMVGEGMPKRPWSLPLRPSDFIRGDDRGKPPSHPSRVHQLGIQLNPHPPIADQCMRQPIAGTLPVDDDHVTGEGSASGATKECRQPAGK